MDTFFQKQEEHIITYRSGNIRTTIDYILVKRTHLKAAKDCKVIPGEIIAMQHRILVMDEVKKQMAKMGKGKSCGPDELPIEAIQIILEYKPE